MAHLSDPDLNYHSTVAIYETKLKVEETEVYVWAAVNVERFEVIHIKFLPAGLTSTPCYSSNKFSSGVAVNQLFPQVVGCGTIGHLITSITMTHAVKRRGNGLWSKSGLVSLSTEPDSSIVGSPAITPRNQ